jgi:hypothetical protein
LCILLSHRMESFELDVIVNSSRPVLGFGGSGGMSANASGRMMSKDTSGRDGSSTPVSSAGGGGMGSTGAGGLPEDSITRIERELREDVRLLIKTIEQRDNVLAASRRAFQKLHRECRRAAQISILKIAEKEQEQAEQRRLVLEKLTNSVKAVDIDHDERELVENYSGREGALVLNSQALSLLNDLATPPTIVPEALEVGSYNAVKTGQYTYADPNRVDARSHPHSRSESPLVRKQNSGYLQQGSGHSPPGSPLTPAKVAAAAAVPATTPTHSLGPMRFSFRRTLGLTVAEPTYQKAESVASSVTSVSSGSTATSPAPVPHMVPVSPRNLSLPAVASHPAASVVVAAGRVGAQPNFSAASHPTSPASAPASSTGGLNKADFTAYLSQIFYNPSGAPGTFKGLRGSQSEPAIGVTAKKTVSKESDVRFVPPIEEGDAQSLPVTPKIMIDDNYFHAPPPEAGTGDGNDSVSGTASLSSASTVRQEPLTFAKHPVLEEDVHTVAPFTDDSPETVDRKVSHRGARINKLNFHRGALEWLKGNPHSSLIEAVEWICRAIKTQAGRDAFTTELNQFRSRKVGLRSVALFHRTWRPFPGEVLW